MRVIAKGIRHLPHKARHKQLTLDGSTCSVLCFGMIPASTTSWTHVFGCDTQSSTVVGQPTFEATLMFFPSSFEHRTVPSHNTVSMWVQIDSARAEEEAPCTNISYACTDSLLKGAPKNSRKACSLHADDLGCNKPSQDRPSFQKLAGQAKKVAQAENSHSSSGKGFVENPRAGGRTPASQTCWNVRCCARSKESTVSFKI